MTPADREPACARAASNPPTTRNRFELGALGLAASGLGLALAAHGAPPLYVSGALVLVGAWLLYDGLRPWSRSSFAVTPRRLSRDGEDRELDELRAVRLELYRPGPWRRWRPALMLELAHETWPLELSLEGWYDVWDCLRELRPDLGLPDWRRHPPLRKLLARHRRYGVRLPPGVVVSRPGTLGLGLAAGLTAALTHFFVVPALGPAAAPWEPLIGPAALGLVVWAWSRCCPPRLLYVPPRRERPVKSGKGGA